VANCDRRQVFDFALKIGKVFNSGLGIEMLNGHNLGTRKGPGKELDRFILTMEPFYGKLIGYAIEPRAILGAYGYGTRGYIRRLYGVRGPYCGPILAGAILQICFRQLAHTIPTNQAGTAIWLMLV
jgi:hypothetical protein